MELSEAEIQVALDDAYEKSGQNAYFGNGFRMGIEFVQAQLKAKTTVEEVNKCKGCETRLEPTFDKRKYCPNMKCKLDFQ